VSGQESTPTGGSREVRCYQIQTIAVGWSLGSTLAHEKTLVLVADQGVCWRFHPPHVDGHRNGRSADPFLGSDQGEESEL
jgi:hypothetical protein